MKISEIIIFKFLTYISYSPFNHNKCSRKKYLLLGRINDICVFFVWTHIKMFIEKFAELSIIIRSGLIIAVIPRQMYDFFLHLIYFQGGVF